MTEAWLAEHRAGEVWDGAPAVDPIRALHDAIERTMLQPRFVVLSPWEHRHVAAMIVQASAELSYRVKQTFWELVRFGEVRSHRLGGGWMSLPEMIERATAAEPDPKAAREALTKRLALLVGDEDEQLGRNG